ncbi:oleate hydratase [Myroides sp. LJL119]
MNQENPNLRKVLSDSYTIKPVDHQPDASTTAPVNSTQRTMPWADELGNYQRNIGIPNKCIKDSKIYIVGSGIAGLAAAYYFIRDTGATPSNIVFLDQLEVEGGSLDGSGNPTDGYLIRGGREMDMTYENVWDMYQDIPALELPEPYSVLDEYRLINDNDPNYSVSRLIHNKGIVKNFDNFGLTKKDQYALVKVLLKKKEECDNVTIEQYFSDTFLASNFWIFWRTMFAFQNWHSLLEFKLYMHRFLHDIDGLHDLSALVFPKYNQHDTFVKPLGGFLSKKGVQLELGILVEDLDFTEIEGKKSVSAIHTVKKGEKQVIQVRPEDYVIITTGSMTEDTFYGDNQKAPVLAIDNSTSGKSPGWRLWKNLASKSKEFGNPEKFCSDIDKSGWMSATLTCRQSAFVDKLKQHSTNDPFSGKTVTGGIITITDSNWLMSFTCNRQPHFPDQPKDVLVLWVYALFMDKKGNYVQKAMPECTGNEILAELCYHLGIEDQLDDVTANTIVRTSYMPYITSMFMPRAKGDRPDIVPKSCSNLGLVGQFVETNNDVVFTMESSVRTARLAVYGLTNSNKQVPDIAPFQYDIRQLLKAVKALNDGKSFVGEGILKRLLKGTYYEHILPIDKMEKPDPNEIDPHKEPENFFTEQFSRLKEWFKHM